MYNLGLHTLSCTCIEAMQVHVCRPVFTVMAVMYNVCQYMLCMPNSASARGAEVHIQACIDIQLKCHQEESICWMQLQKNKITQMNV